jgi:mitochondrial import inner membrane translocase subunit TIM10
VQNHQFETFPTMSFLFGGGRPQPSSAEKIAAAEAELELFSDMFNR